MSNPATLLEFGNFELRPAARQLLVAGQPAKLGARALDLLLALIERRERVVGKNELLEVVWPGVVVEENNLQVHISTLRKILGPAVIATVPGRGYRFTMSVQTPGAAVVASSDGNSMASNAGDASAPPLTELSNLPLRLPVLFGRDAEIARVCALLDEHELVTIAGAGGIGKTRLAQAVAHEFARRAPRPFADGTWLVELAALTDGDLVATAVARTLGQPLAGGVPAVDALAAGLRTQSLLLVLDNCEHLLPAVVALVDAIARAAPAVRILVTSQEPLKATDEQVFRLDTLAVPVNSAAAGTADFGAVQLFVERGRAADARFALTPANVASVVDICRRLDGIPLALELAAARIPLLGIEGLRARLDERLQILTGGSRYTLRRHQTLRAMLDFSHGLLSADEQVVFRRLGVFAGSFAIETAQEVAAGDTFDAWAVLDHLGVLVDKSLVVAEGGKIPRLRLLETTRAYALERLADAAETPGLLRRHAQTVARVFSGMHDAFLHSPVDEAFALYMPEIDNLRAALAWSLRYDGELAIALAGESSSLWLELSLQVEARRHCESALTLVSATTAPRAAGLLWDALAKMTINTHPAQARDAAARAVELLRHADDPYALARALTSRATAQDGPPQQPQLDALDELRKITSPHWPAYMQLGLANASATVNRYAGRTAEARRDHETLRDLAVKCGFKRFELATLENLADMAMVRGDVDTAITMFRELAPQLAARPDKLFYMYCNGTLATALLFKSDTAAARVALAIAAPLIVRMDHGFRYAGTAALLAVQEGRAEVAARLLGYGEADFVAHGKDSHDPVEIKAHGLAVQWLGEVAEQRAIDEWMRLGASLTTEEAYRLALAEHVDAMSASTG